MSELLLSPPVLPERRQEKHARGDDWSVERGGETVVETSNNSWQLREVWTWTWTWTDLEPRRLNISNLKGTPSKSQIMAELATCISAAVNADMVRHKNINIIVNSAMRFRVRKASSFIQSIKLVLDKGEHLPGGIRWRNHSLSTKGWNQKMSEILQMAEEKRGGVNFHLIFHFEGRQNEQASHWIWEEHRCPLCKGFRHFNICKYQHHQ